MVLEIRMNGQAADFRQSFRINLEGATAHELAAGAGNEKRRYARKILLDQLMGK